MIIDPNEFNTVLIDRLFVLSQRGLYAGEFWSLMFVLQQREKDGMVKLDERENIHELWQRLGTKPENDDAGTGD